MTNTEVLEMLKMDLGLQTPNAALSEYLRNLIYLSSRNIEDEGIKLSSSIISAEVDYSEGSATIDIKKMQGKAFGVYAFAFDGEKWMLGEAEADLQDYGVSFEAEPIEGSTLVIDYHESNGITIQDGMLIVMYAAWLYRKRATGEGMPRMLRYTLNQRVLVEKAGAKND